MVCADDLCRNHDFVVVCTADPNTVTADIIAVISVQQQIDDLIHLLLLTLRYGRRLFKAVDRIRSPGVIFRFPPAVFSETAKDIALCPIGSAWAIPCTIQSAKPYNAVFRG